MKYNPAIHDRKSIRLEEYDYSKEGYYFITICTYQHESMFGEVIQGEMILSEAGKIVLKEWYETPKVRNYIELDQFVIMPNHIHGIIILNKPDRAYSDTPLQNNGFACISGTLGAVIRGYKSSVTTQINIKTNNPGKPVWQRNYYEHIIRFQSELDHIRNYIRDNPTNWHLDKMNNKT